MPCLVVFLILAFPRAVLVAMWFFTHLLSRAYDGLLLPVLGFIFLPITTIAYALMVNYHRPVEGINLIILIVAVLFDAGSHGSGRAYQRGRG
ncbi:MAG TPA: hypothetical protein VNH18_27760 [Bryobacteraceae bacterium]|nr:hypothetical protein [Bryobacteraceae bacterium]